MTTRPEISAQRREITGKDASGAGYNIVIHKGADGGMMLTRAPVAPLPAALAQVIEEMG